jgi:hypothetical protein
MLENGVVDHFADYYPSLRDIADAITGHECIVHWIGLNGRFKQFERVVF